MRLFIDKCTFISVITTELGFSCQVMDLLNGIGLYSLSIDEHQTNAVSAQFDSQSLAWLSGNSVGGSAYGYTTTPTSN